MYFAGVCNMRTHGRDTHLDQGQSEVNATLAGPADIQLGANGVIAIAGGDTYGKSHDDNSNVFALNTLTLERRDRPERTQLGPWQNLV